MRQRARPDNLTVCYRKKQIEVSFSCVRPAKDNEFRTNFVKVVCGSTRLSPGASTVTLTMLWRNSWSITGHTHEKLTSCCLIDWQVAKKIGKLGKHGRGLKSWLGQIKAFALTVNVEQMATSIVRTVNFYASRYQDVRRQRRSRRKIPVVQSAVCVNHCFLLSFCLQFLSRHAVKVAVTSWLLRSSRRPRKLFGPVMLFLVNLYLTTEKCIRLKLSQRSAC